MIQQFDMSDFNQIAVSLLQSLTHFSTIEPQLEQEFQQTGGWLKVSKLNNVTGKAARDKLLEENYKKNNQKQKGKAAGNVKAGGKVKRSLQQNSLGRVPVT